MPGRRAAYMRDILKDFRERRIKKADALAIIASSDSFPGWAQRKARKTLQKIHLKASNVF
ncbi:TPA: hypothetical protein SI878_004416 [Salmonella enterica]|nr:hypothetical protein [Salmonella enterica]